MTSLRWNNEAQHAKAVELYHHGLTTKAIAERFGIRRNQVARLLREKGVTLDSRRRDYAGEGGGGARHARTGIRSGEDNR